MAAAAAAFMRATLEARSIRGEESDDDDDAAVSPRLPDIVLVDSSYIFIYILHFSGDYNVD